jgi:hypothetical protein
VVFRHALSQSYPIWGEWFLGMLHHEATLFERPATCSTPSTTGVSGVCACCVTKLLLSKASHHRGKWFPGMLRHTATPFESLQSFRHTLSQSYCTLSERPATCSTPVTTGVSGFQTCFVALLPFGQTSYAFHRHASCDASRFERLWGGFQSRSWNDRVN